MKVWITKYALTTGIYEVEIHEENSSEQLLTTKGWYLKGEFEVLKSVAIAKAYEMKIKKLQSLDKQMKKISALEFDKE